MSSINLIYEGSSKSFGLEKLNLDLHRNEENSDIFKNIQIKDSIAEIELLEKITTFDIHDFHFKWSIVIFVANIYNLFTGPYFLAIEGFPSEVWLGLELFFEFIILVDLIGRLLYRNSLDLKSLWMLKEKDSYLIYACLIVSSFPYSFCFSLIGKNLNSFYPAIIRLFKLLRCFQIKTFLVNIEIINKRVDSYFIEFFKLFLLLFFVVHYFGCFWIFIARVEQDLQENNWADGMEEKRSGARLYLQGLFSAGVSITGIMIEKSQEYSSREMLVCVFIMISGSFIYAFIFGNIFYTLKIENLQKEGTREHIEICKIWIDERKIPKNLKKRILAYYEIAVERFSKEIEYSFIDDLPLSLRTELSIYLYQDLIHKVRLFELGDPSFMMAMIRHLKPRLYMQGDYIIRKDDYADEFYIIRLGTVEVLATDEETQIALLDEGCYFGEIGLLLNVYRTVSVKACKACIICYIGKEHFLQVVNSFPEHHNFLIAVAEQRKQCMNVGDFDKSYDLAEDFSNSDESDDSEDLEPPKFFTEKEHKKKNFFLKILTVAQSNSPSNQVVIDPLSYFHYFWFWILSISFGFYIFYIPYMISFEDSGGTTCITLNFLCYFVYLLDIYIHLNTGIINEFENYSYDKTEITQKYLKYYLTMDVFSLIPIDFILIFSSLPVYVPAYCLVFRVFKYRRVFNEMKTLIKYSSTHYSAIRLILLFFLLIYLSHFFACLILYISKISSYFTENQDFLSTSSKGKIDLNTFRSTRLSDQYSLLIYLGTSVITTASCGDVYPVSDSAKIFSLITIVFSKLLIAAIYAEISILHSSYNSNFIRHINKVSTIKYWANITHIPKSLYKKILNHYDLLWKELRGHNDNEILNGLPEALRTDICSYLFKGLANSGLFPVSQSGAILSIVRRCRVVCYCPEDNIITEGEIGLEMFFVMDGFVKVVTSLKVVLNRLGPGAFFGEMAIIKPKPDVRLASVVAETNTTLAMLSLEDYKYVASIFPDFAEKVGKQAAEREKMNRSMFTKENIEAFKKFQVITEQVELVPSTGVDVSREEVFNEKNVEIKINNISRKLEVSKKCLYLIVWVWNMLFIPAKIAFYIEFAWYSYFMEALTMVVYCYNVYVYFKRGISGKSWKSNIEHYLILIQHVLLAFPFLLVIENSNASPQSVCVFSLFRISNCYKIFPVFSKLKKHINWFILINFLEILSVFFLLNHFLGCYFIFLGKQYSYFESWLSLLDYDSSNLSVYIAGFYWANSIFTHTSVGDLYSLNQAERIFTIFAYLVTSIAYGFLFGSISSLWSGFASHLKTSLHESHMYVMRIVQKKKLENVFSELIDEYYNYIWHTSKGIIENNILQELPFSIRSSLLFSRYLKSIMSSQVFKEPSGLIDYNITLSIFRIMTIQHYLVGDTIIKVGDKSQDMYILLEGEVNVLNIKGTKVLASLKEGAHFGEANIILKNEMRSATIIVSRISKIGILFKKDLEILFEAYPEWYKMLEDIVKNRMRETFNTSNRDDVFRRMSTISKKLQNTPGSYKKYTKRSEKLMATKIADLLARSASSRWLTLHFFHFLCIIYSSISIPLLINSNVLLSPALITIEVLVILESLFFFSINLKDSLKTAKINEYGVRKTILLLYRNQVIPDFFACFPFNLLYAITSDSEWISIPLRLLRLISLFRFNYLVEKIEMYDKNFVKLIKIFKIVIIVVLAIHWNTCAWIFVSKAVWLEKIGYKNESLVLVYNTSLYYVMNVILGSGHNNTKPYSDTERLFSVYLSIFGFLLFATSFGVIASISTGLSNLKDIIKNLRSPFSIQTRTKLPPSIYTRLQQYCAFSTGLAKSIGSMNLKTLYNHLPPNIVGSIIYESNKKMLKKLPFLANFESAEMTERISLCLTPQIYLPNDFIIYKNDVGEEMFFVILGSVNIIAPDNRKIIKTLKKGDFFGEAALLTDSRRMCSVQSVDLSLVYSLNKNDFLVLMKDFPELQNKLSAELSKRKIENKIISSNELFGHANDTHEELMHTLNMYSSLANPFFTRKNTKKFTVLAGMKHYDLEIVRESYVTENYQTLNKRRPMLNQPIKRRMSQEYLSKEILISKFSKYKREKSGIVE